MGNSHAYHSWMCSGIGTLVEEIADNQGIPPAPSASISAHLSLINIAQSFTQTMNLRGPADILRLDPSAIKTHEPKANARDCAPNFFPHLELSDPELPWMFTPAKASTNDRLIPWLTLIVVENSDNISLSPQSEVPSLKLSIKADAGRLLPPLREAYAWAHVEDRGESGKLVSRLLCPVHMAPNASYIACVVPSFEAGRLAGLGREASAAGVALAWLDDTSALELPVYYHWPFSTGDADFETLVRRLQGFPLGPDVGLHDLDIAQPAGGLDIENILPESKPTAALTVSFEGALRSPVAVPKPWPVKHKKPFQAKLKKLITLDAAPPKAGKGYEGTRDDPVITAPVYGSWPKGKKYFATTNSAWMTSLNLDPKHRVVAGLGAKVARKNQEGFMGRAWAQASNLDRINPFLRQTRFALTVGAKVHAKLARLDQATYVQVTTPLHAALKSGGGNQGSFAELLQKNDTVPIGVFSPVFRRVTANVAPAVTLRVVSKAPSLQLQATLASVDGRAAVLGQAFPPLDSQIQPVKTYTFNGKTLTQGASLLSLADSTGLKLVPVRRPDGRMHIVERSNPVAGRKPVTAARVAGSLSLQPARVTRVSRIVQGKDISGIKLQIERETEPLKVLPPLVLSRVTGLQKPTGKTHEIPRRINVSPVYPDATYNKLQALDEDYFLPGYGDIPDDSVSILETNQQFIESYLVGLNHEMAREFAWRQYPTSLDGTWFKWFWNYKNAPDRTDISEINAWKSQRKLGSGDPSADAVVLIKGALFHRYPKTVVYAIKAKWQRAGNSDLAEAVDKTKSGKPPRYVRQADFSKDSTILHPAFSGHVGSSAAFFGFEIEPEMLVGNPEYEAKDPGWFIVFEQAKTTPRFGLDQAEAFHPNRAPASVDALDWGRFASSADGLAQLTFATTQPPWAGRAIGGAKWGNSAAETASLCLQSPVRIMFHAGALMKTEGR